MASPLDSTVNPLCEAVLMDPICGAILLDPLRGAVAPRCDAACSHSAVLSLMGLLVVFAAFVALGRQRSG